MGSVSEGDARSTTAENLYRALDKALDEVQDKEPKYRIPYLKDLAEAYALVTYGPRK